LILKNKIGTFGRKGIPVAAEILSIPEPTGSPRGRYGIEALGRSLGKNAQPFLSNGIQGLFEKLLKI
jgi:hypothetical protein